MKFQDYIQKHKYLLLIIAVLLIMILGKTNTEWNLLRTVWEILLPFLVGCIMAFILNIPMRFIEKRLFRNKSDSYRVSTRIASFLLTLLIVITIIWLILFFMIPQLTNSFSMLNENITDFVPQFQSSMEHLNKKVPLVKHLMGMQTFDTQQILQTVSDFLKDSAKTITGSTISAIGSVFQGIVTGLCLCLLSVIPKRETANAGQKSNFRILLRRKSREALWYLCHDFQKFYTLFYRTMSGSIDSGRSLFADINDFPHALCIADQCRDCLYGIDTDLWCFCRMHFWRFSDFYCKPAAGRRISDYIFCITAN